MKTHLAGKLLSIALLGVVLVLLMEPQPTSGHIRRINYSSQDYFWITETVASTGSCLDMQISSALSKDGIPHVSYFDREKSALMQAQRTSTGWVNTMVDDSGAVGRHSSIALDSTGNPHIAYRNMSNNELEYASFDGVAWNHQAVGSGEVGWFPSLAFDQNDHPQIAYLGNASGVGSQTPKSADWDGNQWTIGVIEKVFASGGISLALDSNGARHVSYQSGGTLRYAVYTSTMWVTQTVDLKATGGFDAGLYSSIAMDGSDNPEISYAQYDTNLSLPFPIHLKFAHRQAGIWQFAQPDTTNGAGFFSSLKLDSQDDPYISYFDSGLQSLKNAHWDGVSWSDMVVDSPVTLDGYTSLAIGADDLPQIAYCDDRSETVKYARLVYLGQHVFLPLMAGSWD